MRNKILPILSLVSVFGILFMVNYTTPPKVGVLGVLVFFTMIFIILFSLMVFIIKIFQKMLSEKNGKVKNSSENKTYMYATVVAFGPIMLLVARPSFEINFLTVILVGVFVFLGCFLIHKRA